MVVEVQLLARRVKVKVSNLSSVPSASAAARNSAPGTISGTPDFLAVCSATASRQLFFSHCTVHTLSDRNTFAMAGNPEPFYVRY